jgi:hypothetical protein
MIVGSLEGRVAGFGLDTRTALIGATGGSIVPAGTGSLAIGDASLTGVGAMGEVLGWSTTGASLVCADSMVSVDKRLRHRIINSASDLTLVSRDTIFRILHCLFEYK